MKTIDLCPFDGLPCPHVDSCDAVLTLAFGVGSDFACSRAVVKVRKK